MNHIYLLPYYSNEKNLIKNHFKTGNVSSIKFISGDFQIELSETNSLVEDRYCLNLNSAKYVLEGNFTNQKQMMIHHHPKGHPWKHLQFNLKARNEVIRIMLDMLDDEDYQKCIKGFLHISQKVIQHEKQENNIINDLQKYFFNDKIQELANEEHFLLNQINKAFKNNKILDKNDKPVDSIKLNELKTEKHLLPFFQK